MPEQTASGAPGIPPTWTSSAKDMVGCGLGPARLWFTSGFGIVNEVYWPRIDIPQIRDLGFIVGDGAGFWIEVKRLGNYRVEVPGAGIPALEIVHTHARFELRLRVVPDPLRDALLVDVELRGDAVLQPYALLAPHLGGSGHDNIAEVATHRGRRVLWAEHGPFALALAAVDASQAPAWGTASAGCVGASDGWQDFARNGALTWTFDTAGPGNVALIGELPRRSTLALGFGTSRESAATLAYSALAQSFDAVWLAHAEAWRAWQAALQRPCDLSDGLHDQLVVSAMVLRVHQDRTYPGAMVASLSIPWGNAHDDIGGYHLVWPRDLVECAGALLALGFAQEARDVLRYCIATQHEQGNWSQNQWLGGKAYWQGQQLDETAFPVLLAAALDERGAMNGIEVRPMVRAALGFIVREGPATEQDRWEEDAGINAFTLATCIAALVCGSRYLDEPERALALRVADDWNARIEPWTSVRDTPLARALGVGGYYVRIAPPPLADGTEALDRVMPIKNRVCDPGIAADAQVATDFLQLVRLGIRDAHDPLVADTLKVVDAQLRVQTPAGVAWRRYTGDGYGEAADGAPFSGAGQGRAWPLLTGERGHYEVAAGHDARPHLEAMAAMSGRCGLIPEQVWDAEPLPERGLYPGRPSGSAMPLAWAHAEFIKLAASIALGRACDRPAAVWERYGGRRPRIDVVLWTTRFPVATLRAGQRLVVCLPAAARVHVGVDDWQSITDIETAEAGFGLHTAELPSRTLKPQQRLCFTLYWRRSARWDGVDREVRVLASAEGD